MRKINNLAKAVFVPLGEGERELKQTTQCDVVAHAPGLHCCQRGICSDDNREFARPPGGSGKQRLVVTENQRYESTQNDALRICFRYRKQREEASGRDGDDGFTNCVLTDTNGVYQLVGTAPCWVFYSFCHRVRCIVPCRTALFLPDLNDRNPVFRQDSGLPACFAGRKERSSRFSVWLIRRPLPETRMPVVDETCYRDVRKHGEKESGRSMP